jgi:hypothetical protein
MPNVTTTIDRDQRGGLYELVRNHLGAIGDVWIALEEDEDFATAERLGIEFGEDFRLLADIGWRPREEREAFELTMPVHDLMDLPVFLFACGSTTATSSTATGIRTPVSGLRIRRPSPLDDSGEGRAF